MVAGEEVTFMDWGNAFIRTIHRDHAGKVTSIDGELHLEGDFKTTKKKLTWLADIPNLTPATLVEMDYLVIKKKFEEDDKLEDFLNPVSKLEIAAVGDENLKSLKKGDQIQLERRGYYICDSAFSESAPIVLLKTPDGSKMEPGYLSKLKK